MAAPAPYNRQYNFTNFQSLNPTTPLPAIQVDLELNTVKISLDQTQANLAIIQRADGQIANQSVGFDQLKSELSVGLAPATIWTSPQNYIVNQTVFFNLQLYRCVVSHLSSAFATDLAAGRWVLVADFTALILNANLGGIPTAATAANGTNTTQLATTAFVQNQIPFIGGGNVSKVATPLTGQWAQWTSATTIQGLSFPVPLAARLTLTTGVAVTAADVVGATIVYLTAVGGKYVPVFDGTTWQLADVSTDLAFGLDSNNAHTGYQAIGNNFDVWVAIVSGVTYFGTGPNWTAGAGAGSDVARGTGAGSSELAMQDGIIVNKNSMLLRFGSASGNTVTVPAKQAVLLGTIRTTADGTTEDSFAKRFLSNVGNVARREMKAIETADNWASSVTTPRQLNNSTTNQLQYVHSLAGGTVEATARLVGLNNGGAGNKFGCGIGIDSTSVESAIVMMPMVALTTITTTAAEYRGSPGLGYHKIVMLEKNNGTVGQFTFFGDNTGDGYIQSGIVGSTFN